MIGIGKEENENEETRENKRNSQEKWNEGKKK